MVYRPFFILIMCLLTFTGCSAFSKGGEGTFSVEKTTSYTPPPFEPLPGQPSLPIKVETVKVTGNMQQPDAAKGGSSNSVSIKPDGTIVVSNSISGSYNVTEIIENIKLLNIPMYAGVALILAALFVGFFLKDLKWAITIGIIGAGMIAGTFLLAKYSLLFLIGLGILVVYGIFKVKDLWAANKENVKLISVSRKTGVIANDDKFKELAEVIQSPNTKHLVKVTKGKNGRSKT